MSKISTVLLSLFCFLSNSEAKATDDWQKEIDVAYSRTGDTVDLSCNPFSEKMFKDFADDKSVAGFDVAGTGLGNSHLALFSDMTHLKFLDLSNNLFDDEGMQHIQFLTGLEDLKIASNKVTGLGLGYLSGFKNLRTLDASSTYLNGDGADKFLKLTQLQTLSVQACGLNNDDLACFASMSSLRTLDITCNKSITLKAVEQLRLKCPDLTVVF